MEMKKPKPQIAGSMTEAEDARFREGHDLGYIAACNVFLAGADVVDLAVMVVHESSPFYELTLRQDVAVRREEGGWALAVVNRSTLPPPDCQAAADQVPVLVAPGQNHVVFTVARNDGLDDDDPISKTVPGVLFWLLHMEPSEFLPGSEWRDRVTNYQRLARAAIERDAAMRGAPRTDHEVLCQRFDAVALGREIEAKGAEAAFMDFLSGLPAAD